MTTIRIIQTMSQKWDIVSSSGVVLQKNIILFSAEEARLYVRAYASSFSDWTYQVEPLV